MHTTRIIQDFITNTQENTKAQYLTLYYTRLKGNYYIFFKNIYLFLAETLPLKLGLNCYCCWDVDHFRTWKISY